MNWARIICLCFFLQGSFQLRCDQKHVQATIGGSFTLVCHYNTGHFLFSRKYWCLGKSRSTCTIITDTEGFIKAELKGRIQMQDALRRGLFVIMTDLQLADTAQYWVGIDKVYADIMTSISVTVSEETVSEPHVWFLSPSSKTCWGSPVTVRCLSKRGTSVRYTWYKTEESGRGRNTLLQQSSDLQLHCGIVGDGDHYYCNASNSMSSKRSRPISTQILLPAENNCIYILALEGQLQYDCWDRLRTSTAPPLKSTSVTEEYRSADTLSIPVNHSKKFNVPLRMCIGVPLWYEALWWLLFASLLTVLCLVRRPRKASGIHTNS